MTDLPFTEDDIYEIHKELYKLAYCGGANGWFATLYPDGDVGYSQYAGGVPISDAAWNGQVPHDVTLAVANFGDLADENWSYDEDDDCYYYDDVFADDDRQPYTQEEMLEEDYGWWMDSCGGQEQVDEIVAELLIEMRSAFLGEISEKELAAERRWEEEGRRRQAVEDSFWSGESCS